MIKGKKDKLPELLTIHEVARMLKVHPETLRRWDNEGRLRAVRIGSRSHPRNPKAIGDRRYRLEDIRRLIDKDDGS